MAKNKIKPRAQPLRAALRTWWTLDERIMDLSERQCAELLEIERESENRVRWLTRIYHRYSHLRREREHKELGI